MGPKINIDSSLSHFPCISLEEYAGPMGTGVHIVFTSINFAFLMLLVDSNNYYEQNKL